MKSLTIIAVLVTALLGAFVLRSTVNPPAAPELPAEVPAEAPIAPLEVQQVQRPTPAERRVGGEALDLADRGVAHVGEARVPLKFEAVHGKPLSESLRQGSFEDLERAAAAGDDAAAYALHTNLERCRHQPKSADELRETETKARAAYAASGGVVYGEVVKLDDMLKYLRDGFERCGGLDPELPARSLELLRMSGERGDFLNELTYARTLARTDPDQARPRLEALAAEGSVTAIGVLGEHSLSHQLAALSIQVAMLGGAGANGPAQSQVAKFQEKLHEIENSTSPVTLREAQQEAEQLLSNPRCCKL